MQQKQFPSPVSNTTMQCQQSHCCLLWGTHKLDTRRRVLKYGASMASPICLQMLATAAVDHPCISSIRDVQESGNAEHCQMFSSMLAFFRVCLPCGLGERSRRYMGKQMLVLSDFIVAVANLYYFGDGVLYFLLFSLVFSFLWGQLSTVCQLERVEVDEEPFC